MAGERILVIDDAKENRDFVVEYVLKPNSYQPLLAGDGEEGLKITLQQQPDLVLLDYNMPRMNGIDYLRALSNQGVNIPVILMTFHSSEDLAIEVFRLGVRDYIVKPFYPEEMEQTIYKSLTEVRLHKEKDALTNRVIQANRELQRRFEELNILYSIGKSVSSLMDMRHLLLRVVDAAVQLTHGEQGRLMLVQNGKLICRAHRSATGVRAEATETVIRDPMSLHVMKSKQPLLATEDQIRRAGIQGLRAAAYVPMMLDNRLIGILGVEKLSNEGGPFTKHDSALLSAISDYISIAIANSRNYEALKALRKKAETTASIPPRDYNAVNYVQSGGKRLEVSVLFAAVRGHLTLSQKEPAEKVIQILNDYLSLAADVIMAWGGTLDRFSGDGLMAMFNATTPQSDHVHRAADSALALQKVSEEISERYGYKLSYSVGINVGKVVVGHIGTDMASSFTAIGDTVNMAKRLQDYAAPGQILVEEVLIRRLGNQVHARPLGEIPTKGPRAYAYELNGLTYDS